MTDLAQLEKLAEYDQARGINDTTNPHDYLNFATPITCNSLHYDSFIPEYDNFYDKVGN